MTNLRRSRGGWIGSGAADEGALLVETMADRRLLPRRGAGASRYLGVSSIQIGQPLVGYTPVFSDIYTGTLYGRWPAAAVWASLLPLMDKHGRIDMSLQAISGMTGWPIELLEQGISQLMEPDQNSRTPDADGCRLVPIDPDRHWGWRAVNHGKYREKARKAAHDERRQESGENAERMRSRRETVPTRDDPTRPDETPGHPLSNTNTNKEKINTSHLNGARVPSRHIDLIFEHWRKVHKHPDAKASEKRRRRIAGRLKEFSLEDLRHCIDGYKLSVFHMGENVSGVKYDDIELMMRSTEHVERGLEFYRNPPGKTKKDDGAYI